jgi:cell wall-associated NlpC family hydrolase
VIESEARARIDQVAREWIGTPYHDHATVKGIQGGCDCATLMQRVFVEAGFVKDFEIGHYSPQFFLHGHEERYLGWVTRFAREIPRDQVGPGDVVLYKIGHVFAHGAIVIAPGWPHIVHAHYAARRVRRGFGDSVHLGTKILDVKWFSIF